MNKFQLLVVVHTIFSMNLLYANPAEEGELSKEIKNKADQTSCLLTTYKENFEFNDHSINTLNSQNILVYNCSAKISPTISFSSVHKLNLMNDKDAIPYPDVNLTNGELPEYKDTVVATVIF